MSASFTADVFARVERSVEERHAGGVFPCRGGAAEGACATGGGVSLVEARSRARGGDFTDSERLAVWQHVGRHLQEEAKDPGDRTWTLIAVWLLASRLRAASYKISRANPGSALADVASAVLEGVLEGVRTIGEKSPEDVGRHLVNAAYTAGWLQAVSPHRRETPVGEWEVLGGTVAQGPQVRAPGGVVEVGDLSGALARRAQGERLGSLAHRLGLLEHARRVRRANRAGSRRPEDRGAHARNGQFVLFELGEEES
ncbi:hypothetical protein ACIQRS_30100 [Streptomyces termitum]|uniref:Uncharacterized protein n=1 Tax=Streptomyces termitum TaxID=67368 RepID=A0A918WDF2_9ACTN|nr:hypothetical protein [Streptomyces termitum]GHB06090.1 hypothetical protein GCM10010305_56650 [Streptomyces termitum]